MSGMPFVVGAYASMPPDAQEQEEYYRLLGEQDWISGQNCRSRETSPIWRC